MQWRNPAFAADGRIDCEIEHPAYGWIPFTVDPADAGAEFDVAALDAEIRAAGGIAPYEPPALDPALIVAALQGAVAAHVDAVAGERQYSSGVHAASYVASTNAAWAAEAQAFVAWRDAVWSHVAAELGAYEPGDPIPTADNLIAALPSIAWPATPE